MLQGRASRVHFHFMFLQSMCIRIDIHFLHTDALVFSGGNTCIKREDFCHNACSELSNTDKPASVESSLGSAGTNFNMIFLLTRVLVLFCCWNATSCVGTLISAWDVKVLSSVCGNVCISANVHQILSLY